MHIFLFQIDKESNIFYKGRRNSIIKRFGNKVDLLKLEELMLQLHFIKSCYVIWDESYHRLHVCLVLKEEITNYFDINTAVIEHLQKLDSLYKPDKIHVFEHVEFTSNGKISMEFLKQRCFQDQIIDPIQDNIDSQKIEDMFKSIWKNNLKHEDGGFVKLGGTSITALQMSSTISKVFNMEFPELIGMLLRDATIDECLAYIKITILNSHQTKTTVNITCYSYDNEMIPLIKHIATNDSVQRQLNVEQSDYDLPNVTDHLSTCQWYKCRGQTYKNVSITNEKSQIKCDKVSKLEILKAYDLLKCVDASPTLFQYIE